MEVVASSYHPGDQRLVDQIVYELKSQGVFDQFRKECFADVDTKPAYQNLRQRVEGSVSGFLREQSWRPDMNKNQVREMLRKKITESGYLETGVERIVDQVVNPKINTVFLPKVEEIVYNYLGIQKPIRTDPRPSGRFEASQIDLLPTDLEAVSPESEPADKKEDKSSDTLQDLDDSKMEEDESPPFEPLDEQSLHIPQEENSVDSHLSGFSGLISHESNQSNDPKTSQMDFATQQDSQMSRNSSDSRLSIVTSDENTKMDVGEDSQPKSVRSNDSSHRNVDKKEDKNKDSDKPKSLDKHKSRSESKSDKTEDKDRKSSRDSKSRHSSSHRDSDRSKDRRDSKSSTSKSDKDKDKSKDRDKDRTKSSSSSKHSTSSSSSKDKNIKKESSSRKDKSDKDKSDKSRSVHSKDKSKDAKPKEKSSDKHRKDDKHSSHNKKDKDKKKDPKKSSKDDHYSSKDKKSDRRSTDRDSNDEHSNRQGRPGSSGDASSSQSQKSEKESSAPRSGSGDSGNSDQVELPGKTPVVLSESIENSEIVITPIKEVQKVRVMKPKCASNMQEVMRLIKIRRQLAKLEKQNQLSLTSVEVDSTTLLSSSINLDDLKPNGFIKKEKKLQDTLNSKMARDLEVVPSPLRNTVISQDNWDAMEAKLRQEVCSEFKEYDDDTEDEVKSTAEVDVIDEEECKYFEKVDMKAIEFLQFVTKYIKKYEQSVVQRKRARSLKRKLPPLNVKISNSHINNNNITVSAKKRKRNKVSNTCIDVPTNQSFALPLSPAESDKSFGKKEETPKMKRAISKANSQRYSSDDLYKPRPTFGSSRRRGAKNLQN